MYTSAGKIINFSWRLMFTAKVPRGVELFNVNVMEKDGDGLRVLSRQNEVEKE